MNKHSKSTCTQHYPAKSTCTQHCPAKSICTLCHGFPGQIQARIISIGFNTSDLWSGQQPCLTQYKVISCCLSYMGCSNRKGSNLLYTENTCLQPFYVRSILQKSMIHNPEVLACLHCSDHTTHERVCVGNTCNTYDNFLLKKPHQCGIYILTCIKVKIKK